MKFSVKQKQIVLTGMKLFQHILLTKKTKSLSVICRKCAEPLKVPSSPQETSQISLGAHWPLKNEHIQKTLDELRAEKDAPSAGHDGASARKRKQA